jgi:uncharacterized protein (TIGR02466 family)
MNFNLQTNNLFPVPVTTAQLPKVNVMDFVKTIEFIPYVSGNTSNISITEDNCHLMISKNKQVLDTYSELEQLKENITVAAEKYWREVIGVDTSIRLKIMHSWITQHSPGRHWNRPHYHNSSIFTSTTYLQTAENCGNLIFNKNPHYLNLFPMMVELDYATENFINCKKFTITPTDNLIVFFPSHLEHYTETNNSLLERFALNVDWWFEGIARKNSTGFESIY